MFKAKISFPIPFSMPRRGLGIAAVTLGLSVLMGCASKTNPVDNAVNTLCAPAASLKDLSQRALLGVGYEAMQQKNLICAERLLQEAHKLDSKDPWALLNLGVVRHRMGKLDEARLAYQMAAAVDPKTSGISLQAQAQSDQKQEVALVASQESGVKRSAGEIALGNLKLIR